MASDKPDTGMSGAAGAASSGAEHCAPGAEGVAQPASEAVRERLIALARGASIETSARRGDEVSAYRGLLPRGTRVFVTWIPGATAAHAVDISRRLREIGLHPVPHIAARELSSEAEARSLVRQLRQEAAVTDLLLIAGDAPVARGPFADSLDLLRTGLLDRSGIERLGVAGYPEGHQRAGEPEWLDAFQRKRALAARQGLELYVVTQFGFDGAAIVDWLKRLRAAGVQTPVWIGMAGPAQVTTLVKYGIRCGIGNSLRLLKARPGQWAGLLTAQGPEPVLLAAAEAPEALGIAGVHLFAFGGFARTAGWIARVAAGEFTLSRSEGLRLRAD